MKSRTLSVVLLACVAASGAALACGESMFNTGKGLEYQGYLAPRPATVLIYGTPDPTSSDKQRAALIEGLKGAGHRVVVVADADAYAQALRAQKVDLVIADSASINTLAAAPDGTTPRLVPVLAKGTPRDQRDRFTLFLRDGAGLGQYLRAIDRALAVAGP
jgi:hypothetical protein